MLGLNTSGAPNGRGTSPTTDLAIDVVLFCCPTELTIAPCVLPGGVLPDLELGSQRSRVPGITDRLLGARAPGVLEGWIAWLEGSDL